MKEYEVHVYAGYMVNDHKEYNCFKEYVEAETEAQAKKLVRAELKKDGYMNIQLTAIAD